jgi:hypothetical protein
MTAVFYSFGTKKEDGSRTKVVEVRKRNFWINELLNSRNFCATVCKL